YRSFVPFGEWLKIHPFDMTGCGGRGGFVMQAGTHFQFIGTARRMPDSGRDWETRDQDPQLGELRAFSYY
ncbi:MAG TPA: hypothetical protein VFK65_17750, partial [Candidatus Binatia bacterium]|nr:hypothetical protein [Candidatus Binatia bacterium]